MVLTSRGGLDVAAPVLSPDGNSCADDEPILGTAPDVLLGSAESCAAEAAAVGIAALGSDSAVMLLRNDVKG